MISFKREKPINHPDTQSGLAEMALKNIHDGVMITSSTGVVEFINPAGITMTGAGSVAQALGLDYGLLLKLETKEGRELPENENPLIQAMRTGQPLEHYEGCLVVGQTDKRIPVAIAMLPVDNAERIITFRDITQELAEEGEQAEFISTASHEMRTPVATIDGYLSLALNPQTATIDERARGYLTAAEKASKHLGKLFQDLLDVTKLDDGRVRTHFVPVNMGELVKTIAADYAKRATEMGLTFTFGAEETLDFNQAHQLDQIVYGYVDVDFLREIMDNLIDNAIKYTPSGGSIYINVRGDGDRALINVTDTGIGISSDDLAHIFQKFYRADNSDTRTIGGTGLGLYMVKQRAEAMGGRVWAESAFGEGSTFFVSLPRITADEYEKRMIAVRNAEIQENLQAEAKKAAPAPAAAKPAPAQAAPAESVSVAAKPAAAPAKPAPAQVASAPNPPAPPANPVPAASPTAATSPAPPANSAPPAPVEPAPATPVPPVQPPTNPNINLNGVKQ